jgi:hypothetical protein
LQSNPEPAGGIAYVSGSRYWAMRTDPAPVYDAAQ